jgi:hypothetical protein
MLSPTFNLILNIGFYIIGTASSVAYVNNKWEKTLVDKGYAEYDRKTKQWYLCSADEIVINTNDKSVIGDVPFGIESASVYIKYLLSELKNYKQQVEITEKQLLEKELLLEKAKPKK